MVPVEVHSLVATTPMLTQQERKQEGTCLVAKFKFPILARAGTHVTTEEP